MVTYYPLTLKEFIRSIITLCQLNRISINVEQLVKKYLTLNYTYDAAYRLTDITDSLSNHIHYTLDTEGNRTREDITDPNNVLTKTLSRSYDALNRMQQLTGIE